MEDCATAVLLHLPGDLVALVDQLRVEVGQLRQEVTRLQRENRELRQQAGYWQQLHARAAERVKQLEQRVHHLEAENRQLRQQAFGRKTEKPTGGDADWLGELKESSAQQKRRGHKTGKPGPQRRDYQHLPVRTALVELPPEKCCCPHCGQPYGERPETEDSEQIEIEVQAYRRVIKRKRYQPRCRCVGPWQIVTAPAPAKLIAKSRYGVSVWVEILLDKFVSQRPTERLLFAMATAGSGLGRRYGGWGLAAFATAVRSVVRGIDRSAAAGGLLARRRDPLACFRGGRRQGRPSVVVVGVSQRGRGGVRAGCQSQPACAARPSAQAS